MSKTKRLVVTVALTLVLLMIPLVAMQFTDEVVWTAGDFLVAGVLLLAAGLAYERVTRSVSNTYYQLACAVALFTALLLVWVSLAVGIIGDENHPANWMFAGVLAVAVIGSLWARLQPRAMARALYVTTLVQFLVALLIVGGWAIGVSSFGATPFVVCLMFMVMWFSSAALFWKASRTNPQ